ncbi:hypothetical protein EWM64_g1323 [Hericium alpestre]|uniref:Ino eighty subunit 1 n=1 Tax=Hericium alpestre TaxID=135208 RepID=A0A4Z0A8Q1_9AGAM|nr:hypothetical protein EWM64_g1323 [Hericium alpestre]
MASQKATTSLYARRKTFAIKHEEAEPLTRRDIQYDFLSFVFGDTHRVFTDPFAPVRDGADSPKITFRDLYVHTIIQSSRCSRALRDKMVDSAGFATDFAKISLLANVGRVNTTMTFLPEMRTSLRTYHPVPSLQKTDGNLQDAPRIKNILKACTLKTEADGVPVTPAEMATRAAQGTIPSTSIVNMLFVLSNHFTAIARDHFGRTDIDFLDLFLPINLSSASRANAFLWLIYHYHEAPSANPFDDDYSRANEGMAPKLVDLTPEEMALENVDTQEEKDFGIKMSQFRLDFLSKNAQNPKPGEGSQEKGKKRGRPKAAEKAAEKTVKRQHSEMETIPQEADIDVEEREPRRRRLSYTQQGESHDNFSHAPLGFSTPVVLTPDFPPRYRIPLDGRIDIGPQRTIVQQAWHVVSTVDPLADDDDEGIDEHSRYDYGK